MVYGDADQLSAGCESNPDCGKVMRSAVIALIKRIDFIVSFDIIPDKLIFQFYEKKLLRYLS